jgi:uncharacterized lipoprotein YajG
MNYCRDKYNQPSLEFRKHGILQKKLPVILMLLLAASVALLAGCSSDLNSVGPSNTAPQLTPGSPTNSIEGIN